MKHSEFEPYLRLLRGKPRYNESIVRDALEKLTKKATARSSDPKILLKKLVSIALAAKHTSAGQPFRDAEDEKVSQAELRKMAAGAKKLKEFLRKANRTPLVAHLARNGRIGSKGLLGFPLLDDRKLDVLDPIIELPALAVGYRKTLQPTLESLLASVCDCVEETTGTPNDSLLCAVLDPLGIPHTESEYALKVWRKRRKLPKTKRMGQKNATLPQPRRPVKLDI